MYVNLQPNFKRKRFMKRYFGLLTAALATLLLCASCLGGDDDNSTVTYNDAAITAFTLGTLDQFLHTTSSEGEDSVYTVQINCSSYKFTIDPEEKRIFNPDSLPLGTDVEHVLCSVSTYNSGGILYEGINNPDSLIYYESTDSIDFSQPRKVRVYGYHTTEYTTYTIQVNVHQQEGSDFVWCKMDALSEDIEEYLAQQAAMKEQALAKGLTFVGESTTEQYALSADNQLKKSADYGLTWSDEVLDESPLLIPTEEMASVCYGYSNLSKVDYVLLIGCRNADTYPQDDGAQIWHKIVDYTGVPTAPKWSYMERAENNTTMFLPKMREPSLIYYDSRVLAIGLVSGELKCYESEDNGITWSVSTHFFLPVRLDSTQPVKVLTDDDHHVWVIQQSTDQIWRGHLNSVMWENNA